MTNCSGCVYNKGYCSLPRMLECPVKDKEMKKEEMTFEEFKMIVKPVWDTKKNRPVSFKEFASAAWYFYKLGKDETKQTI